MSENKTNAVTTYKCGVPELKKSLANAGTIESFTKLLGNRANGFISALTSIVGNNDLLQKADTTSIILAAGQSAAMNLPINPALGMAAIVPYWDDTAKHYVAQFQIERDGWVELAQRSGKVANLVNEIVYEGELVNYNRFKDEYDFSGQRKSDAIIGYMAYVKLTNGFEKTIYWTVDECMAHAKRYSGTFKKGKGLWKNDFNSMALKTVLKRLIKKWCPKTPEIEAALASDQASFSQGEIGNAQPEYIDNQPQSQEPEVVEVDAAEVVDAETAEIVE